MQVPATTSKVIDLLRFPLIVGVVFIHAILAPDLLPADGEASMPVYHWTVNLCSRLLPLVAVPMFFLFSGYLFFFRVDTMTTGVYLRRLRSRCRSLLVPYLFWNLLLFAAFYILDGHVQINHEGRDTPFPLCLWTTSFHTDTLNFPLSGQFWFIRDLMVCVVLSPIIYFLIYRTRHFGIALLAAAWFVGFEIPVAGYCGASMAALFFFSLGGWCARHRADMAATAVDMRFFGLLWPFLIAVQFITLPEPLSTITERLMIFSGIVFCLAAAAWFVERRSVRPVPLLAASSFFIFAYHPYWGQSMFRRLLMAVVQPVSDAGYCAVYLIGTLLTILTGVLIYWLLARYLPRFTSLITGGR